MDDEEFDNMVVCPYCHEYFSMLADLQQHIIENEGDGLHHSGTIIE